MSHGFTRLGQIWIPKEAIPLDNFWAMIFRSVWT